MNKIGFTVTDGWAYRFLFSTFLYDKLIQDNKITVYCSAYYKSIIEESNKHENLHIELINYKLPMMFVFFVKILNYLYKNINDFKVNTYHIKRMKGFKKLLHKFFKSFLKNFNNKCLFRYEKFLRIYFSNIISDNKYKVDKIFFLSPYSLQELYFSLSINNLETKLLFILPSWDNIYKYYTFKHYDYYYVWGNSQKVFFENILEIKSPVHTKGPISQYMFNYYKNIYETENNDKNEVKIFYAGITERHFPDEFNFVKELVAKIELNYYSPNNKLIIRLHPFEQEIDRYQKFKSKNVELSFTKSLDKSNHHNWKANNNFFEIQSKEILNSSIVICVASTFTIDSILLDRPVINFNPIILNRNVDLYDSLDHYSNILDSNIIDIVDNKEELDSLIINAHNIRKNYRNSIHKDVYIHSSDNILDYVK